MPHKDLEVRKKYLASWHAKNRTRRNLAAKKRYRKSPEQAKDHWLKCDFGISYSDYLELLTKQHGVCAICFRPETRMGNNGKIRALAVDHDHKTGSIRGLLCGDCNIALGLLKDDATRIQALLKYLEDHA